MKLYIRVRLVSLETSHQAFKTRRVKITITQDVIKKNTCWTQNLNTSTYSYKKSDMKNEKNMKAWKACIQSMDKILAVIEICLIISFISNF